MMFLNLTSLALAALAGIAPATPVQAAYPVITDSAEMMTLTVDQVTNYIAVVKAISPFWKAPEHAALKKIADSTRHRLSFKVTDQILSVNAYDYASLVKQDASLAAIFAKNHFAPEKFGDTKATVLAVLGALVAADAAIEPLPASATVLGKNAEVVKPRRKALHDVGVWIKVKKQKAGMIFPGASGDGDDDDGV